MPVMKTSAAFLAPPMFLGVLAGCTLVPPPETVAPQPQGYAVPLGVPVQVGDMAVTPKKLVEDSRCPMNARCVWAGRVVVTTRIQGPGFSDTADLTLGERYGTNGRMLALVGVRPDKTTQAGEIAPRDYRFTFEARR